MVIFFAILRALPLIVQIIQSLQLSFPQKGQGTAKAALVPVFLEAALTQDPGLAGGIPREQFLAAATSLVTPMVESMKATGALTPNVPPAPVVS